MKLELNLMKLTYELANGDIGYEVVEHESSDSAHSVQWAEEKAFMFIPEGSVLLCIDFVN